MEKEYIIVPKPKMTFQFFGDVIEIELDKELAEAIAINIYRDHRGPTEALKLMMEYWLPQNPVIHRAMNIDMKEGSGAKITREYYDQIRDKKD
jgi:hypothetical protein